MIQPAFARAGRYDISIENGVYTLHISPVVENDTGTYTCVENDGFGPMTDTWLYVTGMQSLCSENILTVSKLSFYETIDQPNDTMPSNGSGNLMH